MKNPGKIILTASGKRGIAYDRDNNSEQLKKRMGRVIFYLTDEENNFKFDHESKKIVSIVKPENIKQIIGFVD